MSYAADWSEYFGASGGRLGRRLSPGRAWSDANVDFVGIDAYSRSPTGVTAACGCRTSPRGRAIAAISPPNAAGGEGFDWYYASDADRSAGCARQSPTARPASLGLSLQGSRQTGGATAITTGSAAWSRRARAAGSGHEADPVHGDRLPGRRQRRQRAERLSGYRVLEGRAPRFSRGTRDDAMQRRYLEALIGWFASCHARLRGRAQSDLAGGRAADGGTRRAPCLDLGTRGPIPGSARDRRLGRRAQLGDGALAERAHGRGAARRCDRGTGGLGGGRPIETDGLSAVVDGLVVAGGRACATRSSTRRALRFVVRETAAGLAVLDRPRRTSATFAEAELAREEDRPVIEIRAPTGRGPAGRGSPSASSDSEADGRESRVAARRAGPPRVLDVTLPVFQAGA